MQIHRDIQKASKWYEPAELIVNLLHGADEETLNSFTKEFIELISYPNLQKMDDETMVVCGQWDNFCQELYHCYQSVALAEVENDIQ